MFVPLSTHWLSIAENLCSIIKICAIIHKSHIGKRRLAPSIFYITLVLLINDHRLRLTVIPSENSRSLVNVTLPLSCGMAVPKSSSANAMPVTMSVHTASCQSWKIWKQNCCYTVVKAGNGLGYLFWRLHWFSLHVLILPPFLWSRPICVKSNDL